MNTSVDIYKSFNQGLKDPARDSAFQNEYAQALSLGDPRGQLKNLDRPGVSRGAGTMAAAGNQAAMQMSEAVADAYRNDMARRSQQAQNILEGQAADEAYGQQAGGFAAQDYYSDYMNQLAQRQQALNFATGLLGGLLS